VGLALASAGLAAPGVVAAAGFAAAGAIGAAALPGRDPTPWQRPAPVARLAPDLMSMGVAFLRGGSARPVVDGAGRRFHALTVSRLGRSPAGLPGWIARLRGRAPATAWAVRGTRRRIARLRVGAVWRDSVPAPRLDVWRSESASLRLFRGRLARCVEEIESTGRAEGASR